MEGGQRSGTPPAESGSKQTAVRATAPLLPPPSKSSIGTDDGNGSAYFSQLQFLSFQGCLCCAGPTGQSEIPGCCGVLRR